MAKRISVPRPRARETDDAYWARIKPLIAAQRSARPVGRPSDVTLIFHAAHVAMLRLAKRSRATPSQRALQDEVRRLLKQMRTLNQRTPRMKDFAIPSAGTIRKYTQLYLRWRRGMTDKQFMQLPAYQRAALQSERLLRGMKALALAGLLGASGVKLIGSNAAGTKALQTAIDVTRRIRAITTLR